MLFLHELLISINGLYYILWAALLPLCCDGAAAANILGDINIHGTCDFDLHATNRGKSRIIQPSTPDYIVIENSQ